MGGESAIETCRRAYELYGDDTAAMLELFHPEVVVYVAPPNFESGTYEGRDEYAALLRRWGGEWEEMRIEPRELSQEGDWVLARVEYHGRGQGSSVEIQQPSWELSEWRDGLCRRYEVYWDGAQGERAFAKRRADTARASG
jgi:ketosteroid isomerase-like protein